MDHDRLRRAEAEAEVARLREVLERLDVERMRLSSKNERLISVLYVLRDREQDELVRDLIEDALAFDGRMPEPAHEEDAGFSFSLSEEPPDEGGQ